MKRRIGYGGPSEYRHGRHFPGGRINNGGMTEIERLIHLIASMQILFGSRRGSWVVPVAILLIGGLIYGGWHTYRNFYSPERALEKALTRYESSDTKEQLAAISDFKELLQRADPIEPGARFLTIKRDELYQIIISHELRFALDKDSAYRWIIRAWDEGITELSFREPEVKAFWESSIAKEREKKASRAATNKANRS